MFTTLMTAALLVPAAPVPKDTVPTGPAPYILTLKAGNDGEVKVTVIRTEKQKVTMLRAIGGPNGAQQVQQVEQEVPVTKYQQLGLAELKDVKAYTADGKEVAIKDAVKKVNEGGVVVASANGQKVDPQYLRLFKEDVLVFVSPDLIPQGGYGGYPMPSTMPVPAVMPAMPVAPPVAVPLGRIQVQVAPAVELPPPLPPKKDEK